MFSVPSAADRIGILASTVCALHCATMALLPAALGAMGLSALTGHEAEWAFTLGAAGVAAVALFVGWRRQAPSSVLALLGGGIIGLLVARLVEESGAHGLGTVLAVLAGLALAAGHIRNLRVPTSKPCCAHE